MFGSSIGAASIARTGARKMQNTNFPISRSKNPRLAAFLFLVLVLQSASIVLYAQNLGASPQTNKAVQGQTATQPEGAFLNLVNWIGNVIAPVGAALCVVMAIIAYTNGRGVARWAVSAAGLLMISGLTRLIEFWIQQGQAGVQ
jgi:hypothetical protein